MPCPSMHNQIRALQRTQRHLLWLRANLPKHRITRRAERSFLLQQTELALAAGATVEAIVKGANKVK